MTGDSLEHAMPDVERSGGEPAVAAWRRRMRAVAGFALGALAGWACARVGTPIPWMLGPLFTLASLRVAGLDLPALPGGRQAGQWIIGTSLALYFTPTVVHDLAGWSIFLAAGALFAIVLGYAGGLALAWLAGFDRTTGIFASIPGGAAEMSVLGERFGARVDRVAAAHSLRVLILTATIPGLYVAAGVHGADPYPPGVSSVHAGGLVFLRAVTGGGLVATWWRLPNGFVLGSLAVGIPLTAAQVDLSAMPWWASNLGQCLLGSALGARFQPDFLKGAPRFVGPTVTSTFGALVAAAGFGYLLALAAGLHPATVILGTAPGGIAEMCITAKVLQLGVPLVTAFHVTRLVALLLLTPSLFAWSRGWRRRARASPTAEDGRAS